MSSARIVLLFPLLIFALQSCSKFETPDAKRNTAFFLRDTTDMTGELLGMIDDSLIVLRSDLGEVESLRTMKSIHYREVNFVIFRNDASSLLNGGFGLLLGGLTGGLTGLFIGASTNTEGLEGSLNAIAGFLIGGNLGGLTGLIIGLISGANETIQVYRKEDLDDLLPFTRFKDPHELRRFRGF